MKEFHCPHGTRADAYQVGFEGAGFLPAGMTDFQVSQGIYRKTMTPGDNRLISAGVMPFVKLELETPMTEEDIEPAAEFYSDFYATLNAPYRKPFPFVRAMFEKIVREYGGLWPVCVMAMPDGQAHYVGEPHVQVWSDEPGLAEAVGWLESTIGPYLWASTIAATRGRIRRARMFEVFKKAHPSMPEALLWDLTAVLFHDFGRRGAKAHQITGIAHLLNFLGTDTVDAAYAATQYLNGGKKFGACSILAAAHKTISPHATELGAYAQHTADHCGSMISIVADTYDYSTGMRLLGTFADKFKQAGGKLVGRPDSGDPKTCVLEGLAIFDQAFGHTVVDGLRVLNNAGLIQGDGIDDGPLFDIYSAVIAAGYSPLNVAFGMGEHNHKGERSWIEWGYKTCLVGDGQGGYRQAMKKSSSPFKMSLPGPVRYDFPLSGSRIKPITVDQLKAGDVGGYRVVFDGRKNPLPVQSWTFDESRALAEQSWNALEPNPGDTLDPEIRRSQAEFLDRMKKA